MPGTLIHNGIIGESSAQNVILLNEKCNSGNDYEFLCNTLLFGWSRSVVTPYLQKMLILMFTKYNLDFDKVFVACLHTIVGNELILGSRNFVLYLA